jgi:hypothetical protein
MKLLKVIRNESFVRFVREVTVTKGTEEKQDITAHEAPLPAFDKALQALSDVAVNILELGQEYKKGVAVVSVSVSHTKAGTRSVSIAFVKTIDATGTEHKLDTPVFQIDDAGKGEEGGQRRQCSKKHAEMVAAFLDEAVKYANGKRAQTMLPLDDGKSDGAEPKGGDLLDMSGKPATGT